MDKENHCSKTLTSIPQDLIFDNILPRIPVKSLLRFKSVSKTWNSVICTPHFTNSHLQFSSSLSPPQFLLQSKDDIYTLAYNDNLKELVRLEQPWKYTLEVVGCCNGLLCLSLIKDGDVNTCGNLFIVWNPATRQHRNIIRIPFKYPSDMCTCGFGYYKVGSFDDYRIIAGFEFDNCLWVFSLRVGYWKFIKFPSDPDHPFYNVRYFADYCCTGIHLDGSLYWSVCVDDIIYVYSFGLIDEQLNHVEQFDHEGDGFLRLRVLKGCLSIIWGTRDRSDVFVMKKEGDSTSWQKLFSIPNTSIYDVYCAGFSVTGKCLVIQGHTQQWPTILKLVSPTLEDLEHSRGIRFNHVNVKSVHQYVDSLVSPFTLM